MFNWGDEDVEVTVSLTWRGPNPPSRCNSNDKLIHLSQISKVHNNDNDDGSALNNLICQRSLLFSENKDHSSIEILGCTLERILGAELPCCFGIAAVASESV